MKNQKDRETLKARKGPREHETLLVWLVFSDSVPEQEKDIGGETGDIQITSAVW